MWKLASFLFHQIGSLEYWGEGTSLKFFAARIMLPLGLGYRRSGELLYGLAEQGGQTESTIYIQQTNMECGAPKSRTIIGDVYQIKNADRNRKFGWQFNLTEISEYPAEIVRAMKTADDTIVRATITSS